MSNFFSTVDRWKLIRSQSQNFLSLQFNWQIFQLYLLFPFLFSKNLNFFLLSADSGSDEDFLMEDDDDSDYGSSKKKNKKVSKKSKPERKEKKMPKPRLKATGESMEGRSCSLLQRLVSSFSTVEDSVEVLRSVGIHREC